jgi:tRNA 2-thiocytidine biosynthesis protein TtcA
LNDRTDKSLNRNFGKAIHRYGLIADGDRILVGLSGGKDSLALMWLLSERQRRVPVSYRLTAAYIDPGFAGGFTPELEAYCRGRGYDIRIEATDFGPRAHGPENRENPCFFCSRRRRRRLFDIARELGCNKLALGHHKDDLIETLFINMFYSGAISTMLPRQALFGGRLTVIRPLAMVEENELQRFAARRTFPQFVNPCPSAAASRRADVKTLLERLYRTNANIKGNIFRAMHHVNPAYLPVQADAGNTRK